MHELVHFIEWKKIAPDQYGKVMEEAASWGVREIVAHPVWGVMEEETPGTLRKIGALCRRAGLKTPGCHAFWGAGNDLGCPEPAVHEKLVRRHREFLFKLAELGIRTYTLHLGLAHQGGNVPGDWEILRKSVEELLPAAQQTGIVLALENGSESPEELRHLVALAEEFDCPEVGFCFDTGHANCYGSRDVKALLHLMAPRIAVLHIHDNCGTFDDHNPPGEGNIDWAALVPELKALPALRNPETESGNWGESSWKAFQKIWNIQ